MPRKPIRSRPHPASAALAPVLALALSACAHFAVNAPLDAWHAEGGYRYGAAPQGGSADDLLVALSFSGGGTRAAAFALGALEALRDTRIRWGGRERRLLDEVDVVTAVSGGAFPALYHALYGDRVFTDFPAAFLYRNVQGDLIRGVLNPRNWPRLLSKGFDRVDLAAEYFQNRLFPGATFSDLVDSRPFVLVNATDITMGARFDFSQERFDLLCSDLGPFPVGRAAAASSAVPVVMTPVTLRNYGWEACGFTAPAWLETAVDPRGSPRRFRRAVALRSTRDAASRRWIHLFDGGLADNLGIDALLEQLFSRDTPCALLGGDGQQPPRAVLVIVVNAVTDLDRRADLDPQGPSLAETMWAAANIPIDRLALLSIDTLRDRLSDWAEAATHCLADGGGTPVGAPGIFPAVIDFEGVADPRERDVLKTLSTSFRLPAPTVDRLRRAAYELLRRSPEMSAFLSAAETLGIQRRAGGAPVDVPPPSP